MLFKESESFTILWDMWGGVSREIILFFLISTSTTTNL